MVKHILTLSGASELGRTRKDRPTKDLKVGQCMCLLNPRTNKGVSACRVEPTGTGRVGKIKFKGSCPNPVRTK